MGDILSVRGLPVVTLGGSWKRRSVFFAFITDEPPIEVLATRERVELELLPGPPRGNPGKARESQQARVACKMATQRLLSDRQPQAAPNRTLSIAIKQLDHADSCL